MKIYSDITETIGNTPLVQLHHITDGAQARVLAKLEYFNPAGSIKDRTALAMIEQAERDGKLRPGATIVEPTSGNTGIALAMVATIHGYKVILTMPETMSPERRRLLKAFGAELVLTPGDKGMQGAIDKANQLVAEHPDYFMPMQFENEANPEVHRATTAREILNDTDGNVDILVSAVGTGGTITGIGEVLKKAKPDVMIIAIEPEKSPVLSGGAPGGHAIQGIGAGFVPPILNTGIIDEVMRVSDNDAFLFTRRLAREEGILAGISGGAAVWAAVQLAKQAKFAGKTIVVIVPDTGERYLSSPIFAENDE